MRSELPNYLVVGTGPSAVAVIASLLRSGAQIDVVDAGSSSCGFGKEDSVSNDLKRRLKPHRGEFHDYLSHPHADVDYESRLIARSSNFQGGFSRVWGATVHGNERAFGWEPSILPTKEDELLLRELVPMREIIPGSPIQGVQQKLADSLGDSWEIFPSQIACSSDASKNDINDPRIAKIFSAEVGEHWQASPTIRSWVQEGRIKLIDEMLVVGCRQEADHASVVAVDKDGVSHTFKAQRVILAAGPLGTAQILVQSGFLQKIRVRDTPTAFGGFISLQSSHSLRSSESQYSQWWARQNLNRGLFAQFYEPSRGNEVRIRSELRLPSAMGPIIRQIAMRTFPVVVYSSLTTGEYLEVTAKSNIGSHVSGVSSDHVRSEFRKDLAQLAIIIRRAGFIAFGSSFQVGTVGSGFHSGSSLPHIKATSELGCLQGLDRIHIVDSTVLPDLKPGPITTVVMINAIRIGRKLTLIS